MKLHIERPFAEALVNAFPELHAIGEQLRFGPRAEIPFDQLNANQLGFLHRAYSKAGPALQGRAAQIATLEQALGEPVQTFCYPFGRFNREVRQIVIEAGFQAACCTIHALNGPDTDPFALRRYGIAPITGVAFDVYLTGQYAWYYRSSRRQRGKE